MTTAALLTDVVGGNPDDADNLDLFTAYGEHVAAVERESNDAASEAVKLALVEPILTAQAFAEILDVLPEVLS